MIIAGSSGPRPPGASRAGDTDAGSSLLRVRGLRVTYRGEHGRAVALHGVDLDVPAGAVTAVVGESGSGKTTLAHALVGLLPQGGRVESGSIRLGGRELVGASERVWREVRGTHVGLVPQDPGVSLDPVSTIGRHVTDVLRAHQRVPRAAARELAVRLLTEAGIPDAAARARQYPHELSGGLRQRVLIAMATAARPALLVADEPTSALDVTVQRRILDHLDSLVTAGRTTILLVTHDLLIVGDRADHVVVMSDGRVVETGPVEKVFTQPSAQYTRQLLSDVPGRTDVPGRADVPGRTDVPGRAGGPPARAVPKAPSARADGDGPAANTPLLAVEGLRLVYPGHGPAWRERPPAVADVSFALAPGATLGLVGESGSGKSSIARMVVGLVRPTAGTVRIDGEDITGASGARLRALHRDVQMIYQNPFSSLNPRFTVEEIVTEPLRNYGILERTERRQRVAELLDSVALPADSARRRAAELSGGQRQRVAIARALALTPRLLVCDEPVSALDVTVQAQILSLLVALRESHGLTYLFVSHDLAVVRELADQVAVLHQGRLVELADTQRLFAAPREDYTRNLLEAIPGRRRRTRQAASDAPTAPTAPAPSGPSADEPTTGPAR
ncbi:Glutathione import ATP-binding protein GsiA [Frankia sp. AiPs1]|uniref:dipeptide ABC transporter ATP-binding protein n=1 Tax=Frankia sp. AiPa1 TaxID=573492 RepID=UPI00202B0B24|nr:ABC transporter ATP-binding protein [Frankia sp. AiPa1]MCL9759332.1 ABC transporter ATP-binding protein [Frankia sp. AiPa1]